LEKYFKQLKQNFLHTFFHNRCFWKRRKFATKWYVTLCIDKPIVRNRTSKL